MVSIQLLWRMLKGCCVSIASHALVHYSDWKTVLMGDEFVNPLIQESL